MRKLAIGTIFVLFALSLAASAQAGHGKPVPPTPVPTTPSIDGAVFTTVDLNDPNYASECHNGNPANNCNQYTSKPYVFLNGGPSHNKLRPDGVYFFAVLNPSGQANPADGTPDNLSDDYDCYKNREIIIKNGEVAGVLTSTDPACFHNTSTLPVGTGHKLSGPQGPFVQLWPFINTPNPGGVYQMSVCWVGSPATTPTAPLTLANETNVDPSTCKNDMFKVDDDTTPPTCKLVATSPATSTSHKSITVAVEDPGGALEQVIYSGFNFINPPTYKTPFAPGEPGPFYLTATKDDPTQSSNLALTVTDVAGNVTKCDPAFGTPRHTTLATLSAGHRTVIRGVKANQSQLSLKTASGDLRTATISINGHRFAIVTLGRSRPVRLNLASALRAHKSSVISISAIGDAGKLLVRISN